MKKTFRQRFFEFSGGNRTVIIGGLLCAVYFFFYFLSGATVGPTILPPLPRIYFKILGLIIFLIQAVVWKILRMFQKGAMTDPFLYILFFCEFSLLMFVAGVFSWLVYVVYQYILFNSR